MPFTLEASRPNFHIVDASDLIKAYVETLSKEELVESCELSGFDNPSETTREELIEVLKEDQTDSGNITFGDTEYALVPLSRWEEEYNIKVPIEFIDSDGDRINRGLIYVNMGQ